MPQSSAPAPIRLFVVDDHPAIRTALDDTVRNLSDVVLVGEAGTAEDAMDTIDGLEPDVAIIDISLGDAHGLDLVKQLSSLAPDLSILVFSMFEESVFAERAIQAGASGYLMKRAPVEEVIDAIRRVAEGEIYLSDAMTARVLHRMVSASQQDRPPLDELTDRELEVFQLLGEGFTLREIKDKLHVSRSAVDKYRRQAMKKLGCSSVRDLLRYAITWFQAQGSNQPSPHCRPGPEDTSTPVSDSALDLDSLPTPTPKA